MSIADRQEPSSGMYPALDTSGAGGFTPIQEQSQYRYTPNNSDNLANLQDNKESLSKRKVEFDAAYTTSLKSKQTKMIEDKRVARIGTTVSMTFLSLAAINLVAIITVAICMGCNVINLEAMGGLLIVLLVLLLFALFHLATVAGQNSPYIPETSKVILPIITCIHSDILSKLDSINPKFERKLNEIFDSRIDRTKVFRDDILQKYIDYIYSCNSLSRQNLKDKEHDIKTKTKDFLNNIFNEIEIEASEQEKEEIKPYKINFLNTLLIDSKKMENFMGKVLDQIYKTKDRDFIKQAISQGVEQYLNNVKGTT